MVKKILKYFYRRYPIVYSEIMVEEFLSEIPTKVSQPAISFLAEKKDAIVKWLNYEGYLLTRKAVGDPKRANFYLGVITNIKIIIKLLEQQAIGGEYVKDLGKVKSMKEYKEELQKELEGVDKFKKGNQKQPVDNS